MNERIEAVKKVIELHIDDAMCGIFCSRNILGDFMAEIYNNDGVKVDICYGYSYFEIFGLSYEEFEEVDKFYERLRKKKRRRA